MKTAFDSITQLYQFKSGEMIYVIVHYEKGMPRKAALQSLEYSARSSAEEIWTQRYPNKPCPPGHLEGRIINGCPPCRLFPKGYIA